MLINGSSFYRRNCLSHLFEHIFQTLCFSTTSLPFLVLLTSSQLHHRGQNSVLLLFKSKQDIACFCRRYLLQLSESSIPWSRLSEWPSLTIDQTILPDYSRKHLLRFRLRIAFLVDSLDPRSIDISFGALS